MEGEDSDLRKIRWKLALGQIDDDVADKMSKKEQQIDEALDRLYKSSRKGTLTKPGSFSAKWMGEIRSLFPTSVIRVIQRDAL